VVAIDWVLPRWTKEYVRSHSLLDVQSGVSKPHVTFLTGELTSCDRCVYEKYPREAWAGRGDLPVTFSPGDLSVICTWVKYSAQVALLCLEETKEYISETKRIRIEII